MANENPRASGHPNSGGGSRQRPLPEPPSSWLRHLPAIYQESDFLGRFLCIFEALLAPDLEILENEFAYFDPRLAPPDFLPWLATWIDLALDENWPEKRRRALIYRGTELFQWRGTRRGLTEYLRLYAGVEPKIEEHFTKAQGGPFHFTVTLRVRDPRAVDEAQVRGIIEAEKPAHTDYTLRVVRAE
jgi:phage tail-like protein